MTERLGRGVQAINGFVCLTAGVVRSCWNLFTCFGKNWGAIAPRHFRESADQGTIAVRFVVTGVSPERTRLRIDAVFVEDAHRTVHASDGTVAKGAFGTSL